MNRVPIKQELLLLGGGHAHAGVLKQFGMRPEEGVRLTLVSESAMTPYSGMIPGYIAARFTFEESHLDLSKLASFAGANFIEARAEGVDTEAKTVFFADRPPIRFDWLSVDTGSTPLLSEIPGAREFGLPMKPISEFLRGWTQFFQRVQSNPNRPWKALVIGAGAGGVEVALSLDSQFRKLAMGGVGASPVQFAMVGKASEPLPTHNRRVRRKFGKVLAERGFETHWETSVDGLEAGRARLSSGAVVEFDLALIVTQASAPDWIRAGGFETDERGFLRVNECLQSVSHPWAFAAGDVASVARHPRPKSGVFAVRQGPPLERNLRLAARGGSLRPFRPQKAFLSLVSTGDDRAVASRGPLMAYGAWVWHWKESIDRTWMSQYQQLPQMDPVKIAKREFEAIKRRAPEGLEMRCGGCGAKTPSDTLATALRRVVASRQLPGAAPDPDSPEDAARIVIDAADSWYQSVDFTPTFLNDPYLFGEIATIHAINDLYAMGATPKSLQVLANVPLAAERVVEEELFQTLSGVARVCESESIEWLGGHTSESPRAGLGFVVNGAVGPRRTVWGKGGLNPGDALIITQPLGSGALFVGAMRYAADGRDLREMVDQLRRTRGSIVEALRHKPVSACTDVTGFGLAGHLCEMANASEVSAELELGAIPALRGAADLLANGVQSVLAPANQRFEAQIENSDAFRASANYGLLFDPQTAGPFLFGIANDLADGVVAELNSLGFRAAHIGVVSEKRGSGAIRLR